MENLGLRNIFIFALMAITLTGCEIIGDIFEAGLWAGIIIVVLVIALIVWLVSKLLG